VTLYSTIRSAMRRVASVVAGVLLGVTLSAAIGFTWWGLGIAIISALGTGHALRLGEHILEVAISAMLILSVGTTRAAATGRIVETLAGAAAGLLGGLLFAPPRVQPAEEAIDELARRLAALLEQMAAGLLDGSVADRSGGWLDHSRALAGEIGNVDRALSEAEDSIRLNPRGTGLAVSGCAASCRPWSTQRSPSGESRARSRTAPGWVAITARWVTRRRGPGWPALCESSPRRCAPTAGWRLNTTRPAGTGLRPS
jgi:hypothetical protein